MTTIDDSGIQEYEIRILKVNRQAEPSSKGLVIEITDPSLLEKTGGIVQGMSGSPIIQNGMLVGAVTHVLINDPLKGYGIFAEWMLKETDINEPLDYKKAAGQWKVIQNGICIPFFFEKFVVLYGKLLSQFVWILWTIIGIK